VIPKVDQSVEVGAGHQVDAPAITAIAAVRPAKRDVFFAPETYAAITAVPGFDSDFRFINKFHVYPDKKAPSVTRLFVREKGVSFFLASVCRNLGDADELPSQGSLGLEADMSVSQGKKGVVLAYANIVAGVKLGAALANDDAASGNELTAKALHAKALGIGVPTVPGTAARFLVSHGIASCEC
jgi:hypothetical protein